MTDQVVYAVFGTVGPLELVIVLAIAILIFGANRISGLGKGVGQAIRGFKDQMKPKDAEIEPPRDA